MKRVIVIRNFVFLIIVALILCVTLGSRVLVEIGVEFPAWTGINETQSSLEQRPLTSFSRPTKSKLLDGTWQASMESYLVDHVPCREDLLLGNAALQRIAISQMAGIYGYDCYQTFFDSGVIYSRSHDRLYQMPYGRLGVASEDLALATSAINQFAHANPDSRIFFFRTELADTISPAIEGGYIANPFTAALYDEVLARDFSDEITVIHSGITTVSQYDEAYFKTDPHWNMRGAYDGYKAIASSLGFGDELIAPRWITEYKEPIYLGFYAREGLIDSVYDTTSGYSFDLPTYTVAINGVAKSPANLTQQELITPSWSTARFANRYLELNHGNYRTILLERTDKDASRGTLLIVGDSYTNSVERLFLAHYNKVLVVDPREGNKAVSEEIAAYGAIDDIVILSSMPETMHQNTIANLTAQ